MKQYTLENSPLFGLSNIRKLSEYLHCEPGQLRSTAKNPDYRIKVEDDRTYEIPIGLTQKIHKSLFCLIRRIILPDYLHSSRKKHSFVTNAKVHQKVDYVLKLDIRKFYLSARHEHVFRFFKHKLSISDDIAQLLARISCYDNHIPTGSPLSQIIAFWAYNKMIEEILVLVESQNAILTIYVDDITISRNTPFERDFHLRINAILKAYGLKLKSSKINYYSKNQIKTITGCIINRSKEMVAPNRLKKEAIKRFKIIESEPNEISHYDKALGLLSSIRQMEPNAFTEKYTELLVRKKRLQENYK